MYIHVGHTIWFAENQSASAATTGRDADIPIFGLSVVVIHIYIYIYIYIYIFENQAKTWHVGQHIYYLVGFFSVIHPVA